MARLLAALVAGSALCVFSPAAKAQGQTPDLPEGAGKEMVQGVCTACHQTSEIIRSSGYTRKGWKELTATMVDLSASPAEWDRIVDYLAAHFPPNTKRAPKQMPGEAQIAFKEWRTPTLGQRSRDPIQAADGTIWWAGQ